MKIMFLGTGAADWNKPDASGAIRRFSSALLDGKLLIDIPATALELLPEDNCISDVIITHGHGDHFNLEALRKLALMRKTKGAEPICVHVEEGWAEHVSGEHICVKPFDVLEEFEAAGFTLVPLPANHIPTFPGEKPIHYRITDGEKTLVYATDGAWMPYPAVHALREREPFDALVIDTTIGDGQEGDYRVFEHNSLPMVRIMVDTFLATGNMKKEGTVYLTHMARTLHPPRDVLEASLEDPYVAAYDGMIAEI